MRELCKLPRETEWVEVKENNEQPKLIGECISALSNAAALEGKAFAYLVCGVRDADDAIVGTRFEPSAARIGGGDRVGGGGRREERAQVLAVVGPERP